MKRTFLFSVGILVIPIFLFAWKHPLIYYYESKINDSKGKNIIIVYDTFKYFDFRKDSHGDIMINIINEIIPENKYKIIKINHFIYSVSALNINSLKDIVDYARDLNKSIYLNFSHYPPISEEKDFLEFLPALSLKKNVRVTISTGNTYKLKITSESNKTKILAIDNEIWKELNSTISSQLSNLKDNVHHQYLFDEKMQETIKKKITAIIQDRISENELENVINHYQNTLHTYFLMHSLQSYDSNITFVSAHTPFNKEEVIQYGYLQSYKKYKNIEKNIPEKIVANYDNNYSLDCRIDGLVDYNSTKRSFGQYPHTSNGTSQAAPAQLAEMIKKELNNE